MPDVQPEQKDYERLTAEFEVADAEYRDLEQYITTGEAIGEIIRNGGGDIERCKREFSGLMELLRQKLENRNVKRREATHTLRQALVISPTQWRGPDGKTSTLQCGPFNGVSVTKRSFDGKTLLDQVERHGLLDRLLELEGMSKEGKKYKLVEQSYTVDYEGVMSWLKANKLDQVIDAAYDEKESTPQVRGPKEKYFLGEDKKD